MRTGRNRGLDGLAAAVVKLWERSEIAKIAVKRGVQNTNHERMGEELKVCNCDLKIPNFLFVLGVLS